MAITEISKKRRIGPLKTMVLGATLVVAMPGFARNYGAGIENSEWYLTESVFDCTLTHEVPGFGRAVFSHRAGEDLGFFLESDLPLMRPGKGVLVVEAPPWRPGAGTQRIGYVSVSDGRKPVEADSRQAWGMVDGLLSGMSPTVTRQARHTDQPVRVRLSNINFRPRFDQYRRCVAGLLPVNYDQIQRSRIPFASGSTSLSGRDRALLDDIAVYLQADATVVRVFVDGHSDSIGSRIQNRALSEERAQAVADYLIWAGVPEDLLVVRSHADQYPASRNPADNRRATIRLQREDDRPVQRAGNDPSGGYSG